jgi:membrane-bound lytic murein transglycosylase D
MLMPAVLALALLVVCSTTHAAPARTGTAAAPAVTDPFPDVPSLRPQVDFWIQVFTRLHQNEVVLHDELYPQLRYEIFTLPGTVEEGLDREQRRALDRHRNRLITRLKTLEGKLRRAETLETAEQELLHQLEAAGGREAIEGAAQRVRAQRGLQERFLAGVRRSGRYITEMRHIFADRGMPPELAYLPHVESSFNIDARSTVGAAGIWQFTRTTGRRYLHISNALDERLDPLAATHAAADYLDAAHALLGDWALAITSYNHGTSGVLRATRKHGSDLERIVREYQSDSFGFASSNFYTEFLAVHEILAHPDRYFDTPLQYDTAVKLPSLRLPQPASATRLAQLLDTEVAALAAVNPAWLDRTLRGQVSLPAYTRVWLPHDLQVASTTLEAQLAIAEPDAPPLPDPGGDTYRVRNGDTLEKIARRQGISVSALRRANGIRPGSHLIRAGQKLVLPDTQTARHHTPATAPAGPKVHNVRNGENPFVIARRYRIPLNTLLAANGLDSNAILRPGQRLRIPAAANP